MKRRELLKGLLAASLALLGWRLAKTEMPSVIVPSNFNAPSNFKPHTTNHSLSYTIADGKTYCWQWSGHNWVMIAQEC